MASTTRVKIGDEVCITLSVRELREAQQNFGGYQDEMESVCTFQKSTCSAQNVENDKIKAFCTIVSVSRNFKPMFC